MGTDINAIVQRREGTTWVTEWAPEDLCDDDGIPDYEDRWYNLFTALAGVRPGNEWGAPIPVIAEPRGIPSDLCHKVNHHGRMIELNRYELGCWGHSWVSGRELRDYPWDRIDQRPDWLDWMLSLAPDPEDVRFVFGFDN